MGANIASEVADEKFCETTIGESLPQPMHHTALVLPLPKFSPSPTQPSLSIRQEKEDAQEVREGWDTPREGVADPASDRCGKKSQESPLSMCGGTCQQSQLLGRLW